MEHSATNDPLKLTQVFLEPNWTGFYLNGELLVEGHDVNGRDLAEALGYKVDGLTLSEAQAEAEGLLRLPPDLKHLPCD